MVINPVPGPGAEEASRGMMSAWDAAQRLKARLQEIMLQGQQAKELEAQHAGTETQLETMRQTGYNTRQTSQQQFEAGAPEREGAAIAPYLNHVLRGNPALAARVGAPTEDIPDSGPGESITRARPLSPTEAYGLKQSGILGSEITLGREKELETHKATLSLQDAIAKMSAQFELQQQQMRALIEQFGGAGVSGRAGFPGFNPTLRMDTTGKGSVELQPQQGGQLSLDSVSTANFGGRRYSQLDPDEQRNALQMFVKASAEAAGEKRGATNAADLASAFELALRRTKGTLEGDATGALKPQELEKWWIPGKGWAVNTPGTSGMNAEQLKAVGAIHADTAGGMKEIIKDQMSARVAHNHISLIENVVDRLHDRGILPDQSKGITKAMFQSMMRKLYESNDPDLAELRMLGRGDLQIMAGFMPSGGARFGMQLMRFMNQGNITEFSQPWSYESAKSTTKAMHEMVEAKRKEFALPGMTAPANAGGSSSGSERSGKTVKWGDIK